MNDIKPFKVSKPKATHVVIEMFGGDNNLNEFVIEDMREMMSGMSPDMSALCLADFVNDQAYVVELTSTGGKIIESWGEIDTGNPEVLAKFLSRALVSYDEDTSLAIGFWDHGSGVFDEYDPNEHILDRRLRSLPRRESRLRSARKLFLGGLGARERAMLHDDTNGGVLTNREAGRMLSVAFERAGVSDRRVDMIFSDTCLNGMVEVLHEFANYAKVITASEDLEPGAGWDYELWFDKMAANPPTDAATWGQQAVEAFGKAYVDKPYLHPCTLGAFKTDNSLAQAFKELIDTVEDQGENGFRWMRDARDFTQSFDVYATYDLLHFAENLKKYATVAVVKEKADTLKEEFQKARVHSIAHGTTVPDSQGLAFWFPPTRYSCLKDVDTYSKLSFDVDTGWSAYLKKYYHIA